MSNSAARYVGQVEQDPQGTLWAVLYDSDQIIIREQVRSLRKAQRRISDLVLSAADIYPKGPMPTPTPGPTPCPQVDPCAPGKVTQRAAIAHLV